MRVGEGAEGEGQADSTLSVEPKVGGLDEGGGLDLRTLRLGPKPKPRIGRLTELSHPGTPTFKILKGKAKNMQLTDEA